MNVLVTGSSGFVGQHAVRTLRAYGYDVIECDKQNGPEFDLTLPDVAERVSRAADVIVHLAATCSTPASITDPRTTFNDTVLTAVNVLDVARLNQTPVLLTSSVKARDGMTPYGAAKRMTEIWALEYRNAFTLPVVINRPGTIYGPGQEGSPESGWIAWFLQAKKQDTAVTINGDGEQVRDLLHVDDYVRLLVAQVKKFPRYSTGEIYDVGGGKENAVSVKQMVEHLQLDHVYGPARYGDAKEYVAFNNVSDWQPRIHWRDSEMFT